MIKMIFPWIALAAASAAVLDRIAVTVGSDAITESEVVEEIRITSFLNNEPLDFSAAARRAAAERLVDQYLIRHELAAGSYAAPDQPRANKVLADFIKTHFAGKAEYGQKLKQYGVTEEDLKSHLLFQLQAIQFTDLRFTVAGSNEADRAAAPVAGSVAAGAVAAGALAAQASTTGPSATGSAAGPPADNRAAAGTSEAGTLAGQPSTTGVAATGPAAGPPAANPAAAGTSEAGTLAAQASTAGLSAAGSPAARAAASGTSRVGTLAAEPSAADPAAATTVDQQLDDWLKQVRTQTRIEFKKEAFQ